MAGARATFGLVAGLGNTGSRYAGTRHNAGFWYADALAARLGVSFRSDRKAHGDLARTVVGGRDLRLLKPTTMMNLSGQSVAAVARFLKIDPGAILVAHDDIDLPPGTVRLKLGGGHGGNNGVRDVASRLGTRDFWRLRFGVGHPGSRDAVVDYVLTRPSPEDRRAIEEAVERAVDETEHLLVEGDVEAAMHALHTRS